MKRPDWKSTRVSPRGTHHLAGDGSPLYAERFDSALTFHAPGLAPVVDSSGAYHIDVGGQPAYAERYMRTFGFYFERAAVVSGGGWFHVVPDGSLLYAERYAWCGNFQDGLCTVRDADGLYRHLRLDGHPAYPGRHAYAGDFRDGIGVVRELSDGMCVHIRTDGSHVHGARFLDLDIFHKGFARARDRRGWTHVDIEGRPAYEARFAAVEPFYNGTALCETFGGASCRDRAVSMPSVPRLDSRPAR